MTLTTIVMVDRDDAVTLAKAVGEQPRYERDGVTLPRCEHPRWWLRGSRLERVRRELSRRGVVARCVCEARDDPSPRCAHVTWQAASVIELTDGTVLVQAEPEALAGRTEPTRELTEQEREDSEEVWTLRAERLAEEA